MKSLKLRNTFRLIENDNDNGADILDSNVIIKNGKFICNVYDNLISVINLIFQLFG